MSKPVLHIDTPVAPPTWALLERQLLKAMSDACVQFFDHYFDERGYLLCMPRWGGDDGPDDAAENILNWTMLHALGGSETVLRLYKKGWNGHLLQYTEAKTVEVPMGREGMYYKEFPVMFDWFHHSEWLSAFYLQGLSDPSDLTYRNRLKRYTGFYNGDDRQADNWDADHKIIRSMFNGSRGPLMRKATGLDWAGDPIEIQGRFRPGHGERDYHQMLVHFQDYNDVVGDHPMNMSATTLALSAYAVTGETRYRDWVLEYVDAWVERTEANGGLIPTNIGLDGSIGGETEGKWYGGVYGWGFSVYDPAIDAIAHRPSFQNRAHYGFGNAILLTGDRRYADIWGRMIDIVNSNAVQENGRTVYPNSFGDQGWYNFTPEKFAHGALEVYYWSMDEQDAMRVLNDDWVKYLNGLNPDYPVEALNLDFDELHARLEEMWADEATADTRMSDDPNTINPAITETLTKLMLGGLPTGRVGGPLHCRLRYFDPESRRAGIPEDVAALVSQLSNDEVTVSLVNVNQTEPKTVIVQGGAYAEHQIKKARLHDNTVSVDSPHFTVHLGPGAGGELTLKMKRYSNQPTFSFPW